MQATLIKLLQQCHWRNYSVVIITFWHDISLYLGVLLFIPLAKRHKKQRFQAQNSTLSNNLLGILQKLQINFFKKRLWMVTDISLEAVTEAANLRCSNEKVFWKYAANFQENTHPEVRFQ